MKLSKVTKAEQKLRDETDKMIYEYLVVAGAIERKGFGTRREFELQTEVGPLRITPFGNWIAMRFEDLERVKASKRIDFSYNGEANPYSGKWNIMFPSDSTPDERVCMVSWRLNRVVSKA